MSHCGSFLPTATAPASTSLTHGASVGRSKSELVVQHAR